MGRSLSSTGILPVIPSGTGILPVFPSGTGILPVFPRDRRNPVVRDGSLSLANAAEHLRCGQSHESRGDIPAALACYDAAISHLRPVPLDAAEPRRQLALAWMNRGNALQKIPVPPDPACHPLDDNHQGRSPAVAAYDEAISLFETLPFSTTPTYRNHLGAAWLNRGHSQLADDDSTGARASFEQAIHHLEKLPLDENPAYRLNLAGAWTNFAHVQLSASPARARIAAQAALTLLADFPPAHLAFAEMSLRARRALVTALGELLVAAESAREPTTCLAAEASDAIDDGLALARTWEPLALATLRPLALRLFRLGAQLYRVHQPHFLAEFLLENVGPSAPFALLPEFLPAAHEALRDALAELQRPRHLVVGSRESEQLLATIRSLRAVQAQLSVFSSLPSVPPLVPSVYSSPPPAFRA